MPRPRDEVFNAVAVFSATGHWPRNELGEAVTRWLVANARVRIVDLQVTQSSAAEAHCVSLTVFYWDPRW